MASRCVVVAAGAGVAAVAGVALAAGAVAAVVCAISGVAASRPATKAGIMVKRMDMGVRPVVEPGCRPNAAFPVRVRMAPKPRRQCGNPVAA